MYVIYKQCIARQKKRYFVYFFQKFLLAFRMSIPLAFAYGFMGIVLVFAMTSHLTVSIYATLDKPTYAVLMGIFILGCIFKVEGMDYLCENLLFMTWRTSIRILINESKLHNNMTIETLNLHPP